MVYCNRCGTQNPDGTTYCSNCGAPLYPEQSRPYQRHEHRRYYYENGYHYRRHGSGFGLLIVGLFIIIIGLAVLTGFTMFWNYFWPIIIILVGLWVLMLGLRRNRRFRQPPPQ
jgi:hypothetical protein